MLTLIGLGGELASWTCMCRFMAITFQCKAPSFHYDSNRAANVSLTLCRRAHSSHVRTAGLPERWPKAHQAEVYEVAASATSSSVRARFVISRSLRRPPPDIGIPDYVGATGSQFCATCSHLGDLSRKWTKSHLIAPSAITRTGITRLITLSSAPIWSVRSEIVDPPARP